MMKKRIRLMLIRKRILVLMIQLLNNDLVLEIEVM
jgi:hypothetical protein